MTVKKKMIAALSVLLVLNVIALAGRVVYLNFFNNNHSTMVVTDNLIGEDTSADTSSTTSISDIDTQFKDENNSAVNTSAATEVKAVTIELYQGHPSDNEKFQMTNMLPGDREEKYFAVKVSHHADAVVYFNAEVTEQTKNLANILHIKVTHLENDKVIYDGSFAEMNPDGYGEAFFAADKTETVASYKIEVSMPTTAGNECQAAKLMADFKWIVKDTASLDAPKTGDSSSILLYSILGCGSLTLMLILLFTKRREREVDRNE